MTLHVSYVCRHYVLQVSDRLVSRRTRFGIEPFERTANKTVVYFARDAYVSIGYSGLAYLDDRPTDQWIAEKLIGEEVESRRGPSGGIAQQISTGPMPPWLDIGTARQVLRRELVAVTRGLPPSERPHFPQLVIAGWQRGKRVWGNRRQWRPIYHRIADAGVGPPYHVCPSAPRHGWERGGFLVKYTPDIRALTQERAHLFEHLKRAPAADDAEEHMARVLRLAAGLAAQTIGKDYLAVLLPPPAERFVRTRFVAFGEQTGVLPAPPGAGAGYAGPLGYSPWFVHPYYQAGPAVRVGSQSWEVGSPLGRFVFHLEAPGPPPGDVQVIAFGSQRRRPAPS